MNNLIMLVGNIVLISLWLNNRYCNLEIWAWVAKNALWILFPNYFALSPKRLANPALIYIMNLLNIKALSNTLHFSSRLIELECDQRVLFCTYFLKYEIPIPGWLKMRLHSFQGWCRWWRWWGTTWSRPWPWSATPRKCRRRSWLCHRNEAPSSEAPTPIGRCGCRLPDTSTMCIRQPDKKLKM